MKYKLKLDIFEGPLDLLLYLIKKNDLDIRDIPITRITEQYMEFIEMMQMLERSYEALRQAGIKGKEAEQSLRDMTKSLNLPEEATQKYIEGYEEYVHRMEGSEGAQTKKSGLEPGDDGENKTEAG